MARDLAQMSAVRLAALYRKGKASPVEAARAVLARIERHNPRLNALCLVDAEGALSAARASERRWRRGEPIGPLDGVPVTVKELVRVRGWPTLMGSRLVDPRQDWDVDAPAPARLREAGAVLVGQSTSSEYGWKGVTDSPLHGTTRNPWDPERTPGGSSGGAGAAVAAGFGPLAIGSDGGGSVRIPASFCGLVGLKPTFGRVSAWPPGLNGDMSNVGPLARTVEDAALMMDAIARPDPRDAFRLPPDGVDHARKAKGRLRKPRVAFSARFGAHPLDPEVARVFGEAVRRFAGLGVEPEEVTPDFGGVDPAKVFVTHWLVNASRLLRLHPEARHQEFDPGLLHSAREGAKHALADMVDAMADRRTLATWWNLFFEKYDLLLTPTVAVPPWQTGQNAPEGTGGKPNYAWSPFTYQFNLTRHPAATAPCGLTGDGLPVGLQIVSGHWRDAFVLRAAARFLEAHPFEIPELPAPRAKPAPSDQHRETPT